ncbi:MAG: sigma-54 dependent transcriptional regulator [Woeseia sp.]
MAATLQNAHPAVLIVDADANLNAALLDSLQSDAWSVLTADSGLRALQLLRQKPVSLVISDRELRPMGGSVLLQKIREQHPKLPTVMMSAHGTIENAVDAMRHGAVDFLVKPFSAEALRQLVARFVGRDVCSTGPVAIAEDPESIELLRIAKRVAATNATVTISGESGCGKEVVARYIHQQSPRAGQAFVAINCAAIPESMLEAVLFGHEKGAFTGASSAYAGKFEQAQGGTLLLDEISEMDLALQAKLLRVLQEKEVERIGGRNTVALDVRVLATTNRDLRRAVAEGRFREDLYYRLNVFPLYILPLRERPADILPLADMILRRHCYDQAQIPAFTNDARAVLLAHQWPGNVRELENLIQRSTILLRGDVIDAADLAFEQQPAAATPPGSDLSQGMQSHEQQIILDALLAGNGRRDEVAKLLGVSPRTLRYKLARMRAAGIQIPGEQHE